MLAAVALGVAVAYAGHGATRRIAVAGIVLTTIHVAAVSIWIGGLAALWRCAMATDAPNAWRSATDAANTATATATITPAAAGPNYVHLTIDSPDAEPPDEVQMQLAPVDGRIAPIDVTAHIAPDHAMSDQVDIPFPGAWTLTIKARYGDFPLLTFDMPLTIR